MQFVLTLFIPLCWLVWAAIWSVTALRVKKTARQEEPFSRLSNTVPLWLAAALLAGPNLWPRFLTMRLLPESLVRDEFAHGSPGSPDSRARTRPGVPPRDIFVPDMHFDTLRIRSRNFH